jgi:hypothetical protein
VAGPYYVHFDDGDDGNTGLSKAQAWKTLQKVSGSIISNSWVLVQYGLTTNEAPIWAGFSGAKVRAIDFDSEEVDQNGIYVLAPGNFTVTRSTPNALNSILSHQATDRLLRIEGMTIDAQNNAYFCLNSNTNGFLGKLELLQCELKNAVRYGVRTLGIGSQLGLYAERCVVHDIGYEGFGRGLGATAGGGANNKIETLNTVIYRCNQGIYSSNGGGAPEIINTLIYDCFAGVYFDGKAITDLPQITNCTIDDCTIGVNGSPSDSSTTYILNTTISNCERWAVDSEGSGVMSASFSNRYESNLPEKSTIDWDDGPDSTNMQVEPKYQDRLDKDYTLLIESQLILAGDPSIAPYTSDGHWPVDIGAFQFDILGAFMSYDWGTEKLVYHVKMAMGDKEGDAYTDQICLALLNHAVDWYFSSYPDKAAKCGLIETDYRVSMTSGIGSLSADILIVKGARQQTTPERNASVYPLHEFKRMKASNMTKGTYYYPIVGVDLSARKIHLDAENYSGDLLVDYIRKPLQLRLAGVEDEYGVAAGTTVDPEWPSQMNLPILQKAKELGVQVYNRDTAQGDADKQALEILRRMTA